MTSSQSSKTLNSNEHIQNIYATSLPSKSPRKSSAYDKSFERHLIDHNIYLEGYESPEGRRTPELSNINQIHREPLVPRASLSPSRVSDLVFQEFKQKNRAISEGTVLCNVIPLIAGTANIPNERNLQFTNFESLTNEATVKAVPDYFDGARKGDIHTQVRHELDKTIIPTRHPGAPAIPNFFLEAKAPSGGTDVALRQACYDGAHGARAMYSLQNYGKEEPIYDNNAYTFSSKYHDGTLKLYAHHLTAPTAPREQPEYHMTQLKAYALTSDRETFIKGATAFRNARGLTKRYRDNFIESANARARQADIPTGQDNPTEITKIYDNSVLGSSTMLNCIGHRSQGETFVLPRCSEKAEESTDVTRTSMVPDSNEPLPHFATSSSTKETSSKHSRQSRSPSPSSGEGHSANSQSHPNTRKQLKKVKLH